MTSQFPSTLARKKDNKNAYLLWHKVADKEVTKYPQCLNQIHIPVEYSNRSNVWPTYMILLYKIRSSYNIMDNHDILLGKSHSITIHF